MSEFGGGGGGLEKIRHALSSEEYTRYAFDEDAFGAAGLTLEVLDEDAANRVEETSRVLGWPSSEDAEISDLHYYTPESLRDNIVGQGDQGRHLNNFLSRLRTEVPELDENGKGAFGGDMNMGMYLFGTTPALLRARALAPELLEGLHDVFKSTSSGGTAETVMLLDDDEIAAGVYAAYRIMGRLVTKQDNAVQARIMGTRSSNSSQISSAHHAITG